MAHKMGRPPVENPKQSVLGVRVTVEYHEKIKAYAARHHQTISEVMIEGAEILFAREGADKET